jgi:hypothetical protein
VLKVICDHCEGVLTDTAVTVTLINTYGTLLSMQHACQRDILYVVTATLAKANETSGGNAKGQEIHVLWGRPTAGPTMIED